MRRREFIAGLGAVTWPLVARAQQPSKVYRIGFLHPGVDALSPLLPALTGGLRERGWIEGKNYTLERRFAQDRLDWLPALASELRDVDVIVASGTLAPLAAKKITATTPIVMAASGDPVGSGLIATLARPGGNVTGMSLMSPELGGKRLELLKDILPNLSRVAVLWNVANPYPAVVFKNTQSASGSLGIELQSLEVKSPDDFASALGSALRNRNQALIVVDDPLTSGQLAPVVEFAAQNRLPAIYGNKVFVEGGGLMSYGADIVDLYRRSAGYIDKILKGAKPADLPVEQPTKFELIVNLKTAKALGLTIPESFLTRADEVID
jgi:putative ABC transport system substrate-binding protein